MIEMVLRVFPFFHSPTDHNRSEKLNMDVEPLKWCVPFRQGGGVGSAGVFNAQKG
jgi:hypothetical protein